MNTTNLNRLIRTVILAGAVSALALASGCMTAVGGAYSSSLPAGLEKTVKAANAAVTQSAYVKVNEDKQLTTDDIVTRDSSDKRIEILLEAAGDGVTKVSIRVGTFGDQDLSIAIFNKIKANL
jgi:hypothetical protein